MLASVAAAEEELKLRPLKPIIEKIVGSPNPDMSEFAYVSARGAALFAALSGYVAGNAASERDRKIAEALEKRAVPYYKVALASGVMSGKSPEKSREQVALLLKVYSGMILKSKQLNNEMFSPAIAEDVGALKAVEKTVLELAEKLEEEARKKP